MSPLKHIGVFFVSNTILLKQLFKDESTETEIWSILVNSPGVEAAV